jgi:Spy/CpxP family protein refolding chaperone
MTLPPFVVAVAIAVGTTGVACDKGSAPSSGGTAEAPASASAPAASASAAPSASATPPPADDASAAADTGASESADDDQVIEELQAHHRNHHQGFAGFVLSSVETLGVGPDQQAAIDGVRKEFHAKLKPLREANTAALQLIADGVAAGTIDKAKVDAAVARAGTAATAVHGAIPALLNQLHAALKPEQRSALADKVDANWATWRDVNGGGDHAGDGGAKPERRFKHLAKELGLTSDQVEKFRTNLDATKDAKKPFDAAAAEAYIKAFDAAFTADTFDAKKLPAFGPESTRIVSWGAERMAWFYEALLPVLTPAQRTQLADKLRERAKGNEPNDKP